MTPDKKTVETLVEIITREVLLAMIEKEESTDFPAGASCVVEIANGIKVKTCFDNAGHVVSAGAERLTSTLGIIPEDKSLARMIDHTLLKPDATADQIAQLCFEARKYHFASVCQYPDRHYSHLHNPLPFPYQTAKHRMMYMTPPIHKVHYIKGIPSLIPLLYLSISS